MGHYENTSQKARKSYDSQKRLIYVDQNTSSTREKNTEILSLWRRFIAKVLCTTYHSGGSVQARPVASHNDSSRMRKTRHSYRNRKSDRGPHRSILKEYNPSVYSNDSNDSSDSKPQTPRETYQNIPTSTRKEIDWNELPKDDGSMASSLEIINGRLLDHILNFYITAENEVYTCGDMVSKLSRNSCADLDGCVVMWEDLLQYKEPPAFVLRALIARKILIQATKVAENPALSNFRGTNGPSDYRERMLDEIAKATYDEMEVFALKKSDDARLRSIKAVVKIAVDFAITMKNQPTKFELLWATPIIQRPVVFDPRTMVIIHQQSRGGQSITPEVQATVFPGLRKVSATEGFYVLSKAQVLSY